MKKEIHPKIYRNAKVTCACGNSFNTISTLPEIMVEICGACHPYYTGQARFVDTERRIDKFEKKIKLAEEMKKKAQESKKNKETKKAKTQQKGSSSIKEILEKIRLEETK